MISTCLRCALRKGGGSAPCVYNRTVKVKCMYSLILYACTVCTLYNPSCLLLSSSLARKRRWRGVLSPDTGTGIQQQVVQPCTQVNQSIRQLAINQSICNHSGNYESFRQLAINQAMISGKKTCYMKAFKHLHG
jgi:hypothetical protein